MRKKWKDLFTYCYLKLVYKLKFYIVTDYQ